MRCSRWLGCCELSVEAGEAVRARLSGLSVCIPTVQPRASVLLPRSIEPYRQLPPGRYPVGPPAVRLDARTSLLAFWGCERALLP